MKKLLILSCGIFLCTAACDYGKYTCTTDADCVVGEHCSPEFKVCLPYVRPNLGPVVNAIQNSSQWWQAGNTYTLTVHATDPEGDALTYQWQQITGPILTYDDSQQSSAELSVDINTVVRSALITFEVSVIDQPPEGVSPISTSARISVILEGSSAQVIYVDGNASASGSGDIDSPLDSITSAIRSIEQSNSDVLIAVAGEGSSLTYAENIDVSAATNDNIALIGGFCAQQNWSWNPSACSSYMVPRMLKGVGSIDGNSWYAAVDLHRPTNDHVVNVAGFTIDLEESLDAQTFRENQFISGIYALQGIHNMYEVVLISVKDVTRWIDYSVISSDCHDQLKAIEISMQGVGNGNRSGITVYNPMYGEISQTHVTSSLNFLEHAYSNEWGLRLLGLSSDFSDCTTDFVSQVYQISDNTVALNSAQSGGALLISDALHVEVTNNTLIGPNPDDMEYSNSAGAIILNQMDDIQITDNPMISAQASRCSFGLLLLAQGYHYDWLINENNCDIYGGEEGYVFHQAYIANNIVWGNDFSKQQLSQSSFGLVSDWSLADIVGNEIDGGDGATSAIALKLEDVNRVENNILWAGQGLHTYCVQVVPELEQYGLGNIYNNYFHTGQASIIGKAIHLTKYAGSLLLFPNRSWLSFFNNIIEIKSQDQVIHEQSLGMRGFYNNLIAQSDNQNQVMFQLLIRDADTDVDGCTDIVDNQASVYTIGSQCLTSVFNLNCTDQVDHCLWYMDASPVVDASRQGNYHLDITSTVAIDKGTWLGSKCDKDNIRRECKRPDIGPYEVIQTDCQALPCD